MYRECEQLSVGDTCPLVPTWIKLSVKATVHMKLSWPLTLWWSYFVSSAPPTGGQQKCKGKVRGELPPTRSRDLCSAHGESSLFRCSKVEEAVPLLTLQARLVLGRYWQKRQVGRCCSQSNNGCTGGRSSRFTRKRRCTFLFIYLIHILFTISHFKPYIALHFHLHLRWWPVYT